MPDDTLPLRIVLLDPPRGVTWALQEGRDRLVPPVHASPDRIVLETTVTLGPAEPDGARPCRGAAVQGPKGKRFLYANSGAIAGDATAAWQRRAKIPLPSLPPALVAELARAPDAVLEARVAGKARDGGPAAASVPILDGGWRVVASRTKA